MSSDAIVSNLRNDIKTYMEATIAQVKSRAASETGHISVGHSQKLIFGNLCIGGTVEEKEEEVRRLMSRHEGIARAGTVF